MFVLSEYIYIFSSYFIFVEPLWLKQIQKRSNRKKNLPLHIYRTKHNHDHVINRQEILKTYLHCLKNKCFKLLSKTPLKDTPDVVFLVAIIKFNFDALQRCLETGVYDTYFFHSHLKRFSFHDIKTILRRLIFQDTFKMPYSSRHF